MKIIRANDYADMSRKAANILSAQIILKPDCVLGLATGGTPVGAYQQLVEWYNKGDQLLVGAHGRTAGGQAQHAVGLHDDLGRDDVGGLAGHVVVIFCTDDLHKKIPPDLFGVRCPSFPIFHYTTPWGGIL